MSEKGTQDHSPAARARRAETDADAPRSRPWVLWDGDCGFCARITRWIESHDDEEQLELVPYQEAPDPPVGDALREAASRSIHVLFTDGGTIRSGRACLFILSCLGFERTSRTLGHRPLLWLVEIGYWLVARTRGLLGRFLPAP